MTMNIIDAVNSVAPHARGNYLEAIRQGGPLFLQHGITTPLRAAHFLAQALHETGLFTILRENMNYSAGRLVEIFGVGHHSAAVTASEAATLGGHPEAISERVYGLGNLRKARELGNTETGDGFLYRGNGVMQTTGRGSHRRMGNACGVDFEGNPELVTSPEHALKPALQEWTDNNLNSFADRNDIRSITRKINGGFNGLAEREALFDKIFPLLREGNDLAEPSEAADVDDDMRSLQESLNQLGANPELTVDGRFGPATRRAVTEFQAVAGIGADGIPGPVTMAAINLRLDRIR